MIRREEKKNSGLNRYISLGYAPENLPFARGHIPTLERGAGAHRDI